MLWVGTEEAPDLAGPGQPLAQALGAGRPGVSMSAPGAPARHGLPSAGNPGVLPMPGGRK